DDGALTQQQFIGELHQTVAHLLAQPSYEMQPVLADQLLDERLRDVALVSEELANEGAGLPCELGHGLAIIDIAGAKAETEQLSAVVDHQMQLAAIEPAERGLAPAGRGGKDAVLADTRRMADLQRRRVDKADAGAAAHLLVEIGEEWDNDRRHQLHEALLAHQRGKLAAQVPLDMLGVGGLEGAVGGAMEPEKKGHDLAGVQLWGASPAAPAAGELLRFPARRESLPELIHRAEHVEYTHYDTSSGLMGLVHTAS